ncbi:MAG TPA: peptidoglycan-binding domain-containing protein [Blastocatellia bacterium]|nr:peptidoglycan-binding domain-containing protein [Blastocatellia bacterium]
MRRGCICILMLALFAALASPDVASAKKSRSRGASRQAKQKTNGAVSRRQKGGRKNQAVRGKRGRRLASSRRRNRTRYEAEPIVASSAPRPAPGIPAERVTEIQTALIKAGYMDGPASGLYDESTVDAMKEFQAKHGLSQTGLPSASLLKKLGVPKGSNDGYAVPVTRVSETDKKRSSNEKPEL